MSERPILFNGPMVRALLAGRKTQTRRIIKPRCKALSQSYALQFRAPGDKWYGDHVWSFRRRDHGWEDYTNAEFLALCPYGAPGDRLWVREAWTVPPGSTARAEVVYRADDEELSGPWTPSIHMPRWASRIVLEVVEVRAQRLLSISEDDARAEGVGIVGFSYRKGFEHLWNVINAEPAEQNPFVWAVTFKRVQEAEK